MLSLREKKYYIKLIVLTINFHYKEVILPWGYYNIRVNS